MKIMMAYFEKFIHVSGGIEHMLSKLANEFVSRGHQVDIVYCYGDSGKCFYPLDDSIKLHNLMAIHPEKWKDPQLSQCISGKTKFIREIIRAFNPGKGRDYNEAAKGKLIAGEIRQVIDEIKPDVIISLRYETSNYLINSAKVTVPVITRSFLDPAVMLKNAPRGEITALQKSAVVHVLQKQDIPVMKKLCPGANVVWIPNPVPQYDEQADLKRNKKKYTIINVARLNKDQKRQHLIVQAFAKLAKNYPEWQVELWGGENDPRHGYGNELKNLINTENLSNQVYLRGETHEVLEKELNADIFCFPSAYEGFPNALAEAMSAGLPPIICKSCPSAGALVENDVNGIICDDSIEGIASALKILMDSKKLRIRLGNQAKEEMKQYRPRDVFDMWENTIKKCLEHG